MGKTLQAIHRMFTVTDGGWTAHEHGSDHAGQTRGHSVSKESICAAGTLTHNRHGGPSFSERRCVLR